ncbi:hypothetical protein ASF71_10000 [Deinococcus sp. Leaf326]|nr:hypothetical protein ASF71_10000 [Deinococcus sp. Leaf326]
MNMSFTFQPVPRDFSSLPYALYRVRQISRDQRENPPFSLSDEEWTEVLKDTKRGVHFQVFSAVAQVVSTDPTRLQALTEASGSYTFSDLEAVKASLKEQQAALNKQLGVKLASVGSVTSLPSVTVW